MRQNKFRIWDKIYKAMFQVSDISWACDGSIVYINGCLADNFILMQSTGLPDRNGKEIFQGDIISFSIFDWQDDDKQYTGVVTFEDGAMIIKKDEIDYLDLSYVYYQDDEMEIIGNIHENPELLEVSK